MKPIAALPCPFCGAEQKPEEETSYQDTGEGYKYGTFACRECGAQGPSVRTGYRAWNRMRAVSFRFGLKRKMTTWGNDAIREWNVRKPEASK